MVESSGKFRTHSEAIIHLIESGLEERMHLPAELKERLRKHANFLARDEKLFVQQAIEGMCDLIEGKKSASTLQLEYRFRQELLRGNTADFEVRLGFAASSDSKGILDKLQFPAKKRFQLKSSAIYAQSFLTNFIHSEGGEVSLGTLTYAFNFLIERELLRKSLEAISPEKVRRWINEYPEKPQAAHFLPALKELASHGIIKLEPGTKMRVKLLRDGDGNAWAEVDAAMVRAAVKETFGELQDEDIQRVQEDLAPNRKVRELLAA